MSLNLLIFLEVIRGILKVHFLFKLHEFEYRYLNRHEEWFLFCAVLMRQLLWHDRVTGHRNTGSTRSLFKLTDVIMMLMVTKVVSGGITKKNDRVKI
jgi:hypothetical protein